MRALDGAGEALPAEDASADAIVVAQAFHWFDVPRALAEFHRVLRPGGRFADGLVDRVGSISFIAALPDDERGQVLARVRALALDRGQPRRLGYTTEAYAYARR